MNKLCWQKQTKRILHRHCGAVPKQGESWKEQVVESLGWKNLTWSFKAQGIYVEGALSHQHFYKGTADKTSMSIFHPSSNAILSAIPSLVGQFNIHYTPILLFSFGWFPLRNMGKPTTNYEVNFLYKCNLVFLQVSWKAYWNVNYCKCHSALLFEGFESSHQLEPLIKELILNILVVYWNAWVH